MIIVDCIKLKNWLIRHLKLIVRFNLKLISIKVQARKELKFKHRPKELKFKHRPKNLLLIIVLMGLRMLIMNLIKKRMVKEIQKLNLIIYLVVMEQRFTDQCQIQVLRRQLV